MKLKALILPVLAIAALCGRVRSEEQTQGFVRDLRSPYLEVRETAAARLAAGGRSGALALRSAYRQADYRTKVLILVAFERRAPGEAIELVLGDLDCPDRGVYRAQLGVVSAVYSLPRDLVAEEARRGVPLGDWELEEGLRSIPARVPSAGRALARLLAAESPRLRQIGNRLRPLLADVDRLRDLLARAREDQDPRRAARAREIEGHLLRHDVERLLSAVFQAGGREGAYEGMYGVVGDLLATEGRSVISVLLSILKDREPAGEGVPASAIAPYRFREPLPLDASVLWMRRRAAYCIGDIGDGQAGLELEEYYDRELANLDLDPYEDLNVREEVAHACAALGRPDPLRGVVRYYRGRYLGASDLSRLAAAYARLGEWELARARFEEAVREESDGYIYALYNLACVLSRMGRITEALAEIDSAVKSGYGLDPSHLEWLERDGDLAEVRKHPAYARIVAEIKRELSR